MRNTLAALSLLLVAGCSALAPNVTTVPVTPPTPVPLEAPGVATIQATPTCGDIEGMAAKWASILRMGDWRIAVGCSVIPDSENAWAISHVAVETRELTAVIDPRTPDIDATVLHEVLHGFLSNIRAANSDTVEEQEVRTLVEAITGRKTEGGQ